MRDLVPPLIHRCSTAAFYLGLASLVPVPGLALVLATVSVTCALLALRGRRDAPVGPSETRAVLGLVCGSISLFTCGPWGLLLGYALLTQGTPP